MHHHHDHCIIIIVITTTSPVHHHQCITISALSSVHHHQCIIIISSSSVRHHHQCIIISVSSSVHHHQKSWGHFVHLLVLFQLLVHLLVDHPLILLLCNSANEKKKEKLWNFLKVFFYDWEKVEKSWDNLRKSWKILWISINFVKGWESFLEKVSKVEKVEIMGGKRKKSLWLVLNFVGKPCWWRRL